MDEEIMDDEIKCNEEVNSPEQKNLVNIQIGDLIGGKVPLTKLFSVIEKGIGKAFASYFDRKKASAKAFEIETIANKIGEKRHLVDSIEYKNDGIVIVAKTSPEDRAISRINHQQFIQQENVENIVQIAAQQLSIEEAVSDEMPDDDWIANFFQMAGTVSNEKMQLLWGKILSGEIKQPNSYSLRTLNLLKLISKEEAALFASYAKFVIWGAPNLVFTLDGDRLKKEGFIYANLLKLQNLGLINMTFGLNLPFSNPEHTIRCNGYLIIAKSKIEAVKLNIITVTDIGMQILSLIEPEISPLNYIIEIGNSFKDKYSDVYYAKIISTEEDGSFKHHPFVKL